MNCCIKAIKHSQSWRWSKIWGYDLDGKWSVDVAYTIFKFLLYFLLLSKKVFCALVWCQRRHMLQVAPSKCFSEPQPISVRWAATLDILLKQHSFLTNLQDFHQRYDQVSKLPCFQGGKKRGGGKHKWGRHWDNLKCR